MHFIKIYYKILRLVCITIFIRKVFRKIFSVFYLFQYLENLKATI